MKAVLVIEMPQSCAECPMEMDVADTSGELWKGNICKGCGKRNADRSKKPEWCPLVPMPERMALCGTYNSEYLANGGKVPSYKVGWNECLNVIEGSKRNDGAGSIACGNTNLERNPAVHGNRHS